jgi:hypothetical protein
VTSWFILAGKTAGEWFPGHLQGFISGAIWLAVTEPTSWTDPLVL